MKRAASPPGLGPLLGAVQAFRLGMDATGCEALAIFTQTLEAAFQSTHMPLPAAAFPALLQEIAEAQQRGDNLRVADLLEFKVAPLYVKWRQAHSSAPGNNARA